MLKMEIKLFLSQSHEKGSLYDNNDLEDNDVSGNASTHIIEP